MATVCRLGSRLALFGLLAALISGCSQEASLPRVLRVAKGSTNPGSLDIEESVRDRRVVKELQALFQDFDPGLRLHPTSYSEANLVEDIARQTSSGLGPDLIVTNGNTALTLLEQDLTHAIPLQSKVRSRITPMALQRVTTASGAIAGIPVSQYLQLACYDKRRLPQPPTTLQDLAKASGQGKVFGLAMHLEDLYWTLGGFDATPALEDALQATPTSTDHNQRLTAWLQWLQNASFQQNVLFFSNQTALSDQLIQGKLDWITCWSSQLPQLRKALQQHLGITTLPKGPLGKATPITRLQVWALGRNSSARQQRDSLKLLSFMVEPWAQKTLALKYRTSFPVNPQVAPIVERQLAGERQLTTETVQLGLSDLPSTQHANSVVAAIGSNPERLSRVNGVLNSVIFGTRNATEGSKALRQTLKGEQP